MAMARPTTTKPSPTRLIAWRAVSASSCTTRKARTYAVFEAGGARQVYGGAAFSGFSDYLSRLLHPARPGADRKSLKVALRRCAGKPSSRATPG